MLFRPAAVRTRRSSIFRHAMIDFVGPGADAALHALHVFKALLLEELESFHRTLAALAVNVDRLIGIEFSELLRQRPKREKWHPIDVRDLVFVWVANVNDFDPQL